MSDFHEMISRHVDQALSHGFGSFDTPPEGEEYVSERVECPHAGCQWALDTERRAHGEIVALRGREAVERLCQDHLETHLDPAVRGLTAE